MFHAFIYACSTHHLNDVLPIKYDIKKISTINTFLYVLKCLADEILQNSFNKTFSGNYYTDLSEVQDESIESFVKLPEPERTRESRSSRDWDIEL